MGLTCPLFIPDTFLDNGQVRRLILNDKTKKRWSRQAKKEIVLRTWLRNSGRAISGAEFRELSLGGMAGCGCEAMDIGLKGKGKEPADKELEQARNTIGRLTMELELFRGKAKRRIL